MKFRAAQYRSRPDELAVPLLRAIALAGIMAEADRRTLEALRTGGSVIAVGDRAAALRASLDGMTRQQLEDFDAAEAWA